MWLDWAKYHDPGDGSCVLVCLFDTTAHTFFLAAPSGQPLSDMCGKPRTKNVDKPMAEFWASTKHGGNLCNVWHAPQPVDTQDAMCGTARPLDLIGRNPCTSQKRFLFFPENRN